MIDDKLCLTIVFIYTVEDFIDIHFRKRFTDFLDFQLMLLFKLAETSVNCLNTRPKICAINEEGIKGA